MPVLTSTQTPERLSDEAFAALVMDEEQRLDAYEFAERLLREANRARAVESSHAEQLAAKAEEIARLRAELGGILEQVRSMGCPPATDEACPMCVLERLVRAALAPYAAPEPCDCEPETITCGRNDCRKREAAKGGES